MKTLVRAVLVLWIAFVLMHAYYFFLAVRETPHPSYVPLLLFVAVQVLALLCSVGIGFWLIFFGKGIRVRAFSWTLLGVLPAFIWYSQVALSFQFLVDRQSEQVEPTWYLCSSETITSALVNGIGRFTLPYKIEGKRIIMFYDGRIEDPVGDAAKMDSFVLENEKALGIELSHKIHWFRSPILGIPGFAMNGVSVANPEVLHNDTDRVGHLNSVDFHEIAHNILPVPTTFTLLGKTCPPAFFVEGWAQAKSDPIEKLLEECQQLKIERNALLFRVLVSSKYYFQTDRRIYQLGGGFVYFLIESQGIQKFHELYTNCSMHNFAKDFEKVYGISLDQAEILFWEWIQENYSFSKATANLSDDEKEFLKQFREFYERQNRVYDEIVSRGTFHIKCNISSNYEMIKHFSEEETFLYIKDVKHFRSESLCKQFSENLKTLKNSTKDIVRIDILFPEVRYFSMEPIVHSENGKIGKNEGQIYQYAITPGDWSLQKERYLADHTSFLKPFCLFGRVVNNSFTKPELYFWNPSNGTTIRSVIKGENEVVQVICDIRYSDPQIVGELLLDLDAQNDWVLLKAEYRHFIDSVLVRTLLDEREYKGTFNEIPLLKKQSCKEESFGDRPLVLTSTTELVHHDTMPVSESELLKDVEFNIPKQPFRWNAAKMLKRDLAIIACWFAISIFATRKTTEKGKNS